MTASTASSAPKVDVALDVKEESSLQEDSLETLLTISADEDVKDET